MVEHTLNALTSLGEATARVARFEGLVISENISRALGSVACRRGQAEACEAALREMLGDAPPVPGKLVAGGEISAFWTGPEQWFVDASFATHEDIAAILEARFGGSASITEQTDAWARFDLDGPGAVAVLERLCPLDTARMESGSAARSLVEHIGAYVLCWEAGARFAVIGPRSSAASLFHALEAAAQSAL